jgi:hypothetical protein
MAKVTGPLFSVSASGKIADSIVFFGWKGVNVVRQWLVPANPKSELQGNQRTMLGGTGKAVGKIQPEKAFAQQLIDLSLIPGGQTKQSYIVKYILTNYLTNATTYAEQLALCTGHTAYTSFEGLATALDVADFSLAYDDIATYDKALGMYLIAKTAIALGFTGAPYTTPLTEWITTHVYSMGKDFTSA